MHLLLALRVALMRRLRRRARPAAAMVTCTTRASSWRRCPHALDDDDIQEIAMTLNFTPRKCLQFRSPLEAFLAELGKDVDISFNGRVALRG